MNQPTPATPNFQTYNGSAITFETSGNLTVRVWKNYYLPNNITAQYFVDLSYLYETMTSISNTSLMENQNQSEFSSQNNPAMNEGAKSFLSNFRYNFLVCFPKLLNLVSFLIISYSGVFCCYFH